MFFGALALTTFSYVGCKDYDDDIDRLEQKITENANAIAEINKLIEGGSVITKVENITGGVEVTLSNGKSFTIKNGDAGKDGTQWTIGEDGYWYQDGKKTEFKAKGDKGDPGEPGTPGTPGEPGQPGTPGDPGEDGDTYIPGEDGFWYKNEVKPENKTDMTWIIPGVVSVADMGDYYIFSNLRTETGEATSAKIYKYSATFVSSLVHVTSNINEDLGDVVFLPVIGYDENSTGITKVYEYNSALQPLYRTLVNGWAEYEYKLNPANVNPKYYEGLGFIEQTATTTTRAVEIGLPLSKISVNSQGKLVVKASAGNNTDNPNVFKMYKASEETEENVYDNPDGKPMEESSKYGEAGKVNMLAYRVKNTNENEKFINDGIVVSDFVATKRMVVEQDDAMIGITIKDGNLNDQVTTFTDLTHMYAEELNAAQRNNYIASNINVPVIANVLYTDQPVLLDYIRDYAVKFYTNTDFSSKDGQYRLEDLGFENITFEFEDVHYTEAEVGQTERYVTFDSKTGKMTPILVDGKVQTASIGREPVVKVKMFVDGKWVMSKLLKIKLVETEQLTDTWTNEDLTDQVLGCTALVGGEDMKQWGNGAFANANVVDGLKIDFDQYFNKLGVSKEKFVELYGDGITGGTNSVKVFFTDAQTGVRTEYTKWAAYINSGYIYKDPSKNWNLMIDWANIFGGPTTENNYLYFGLTPEAHAGKYEVELSFSTESTLATYKAFKIKAEFNVTDPAAEWTYNPSMWAAGNNHIAGTEYMLGYGYPTEESNTGEKPFSGTFKMSCNIEDGMLTNNLAKVLPCGTICFELVNPTQYGGDVTLAYNEETNKHVLTINQFDCKWLEQPLEIRAYVYVGSYGVDRKIPIAIPGVTTKKEPTGFYTFNVRFVDPVSYEVVNNGSWYLVDGAADNVNEGHYLPIYRLFKLWDTHKTTTNGLMWDPAIQNGWFVRNGLKIGESLYEVHNVNIKYAINAADQVENKEFVVTHASISDKGVLSWSNLSQEGGSAVTNDQPVVVTVTITHDWNKNCTSKVLKITVPVKRADTEYKMPSVGFLKNNEGKNDKTLGLN